jgi:glycosyltransferase involved in cell wall biosynthesis
LRVLYLQGAGERAGAEVALLGRIRHLPEHGVEPIVVFLASGPFVDEVRDAGVETLVLADEPPRVRELWRLPAAVRAVAAAARRVGADVVEGVGEKMSLLAGWAARGSGPTAVYSLHDAPNRSLEGRVVQLGAITGRHAAVVVPSQWMAQAFRRAWGLHAEVVPNALVLEDFPQTGADVRGLAGWEPDTVVAGLFGRLVGWKGQEVLLRAAARARGSGSRLRFLVVGGTLYGWEGHFAERLRRLAAELDVEAVVHFTGHRESALELMAGCDIVCHCSLEPEPFGVVVTEGMALGRPVVATRSGGPEELIEHGRTGLLVHPGDDAELADALERLASSAELRARLGEAARTHARREYSAAKVAGELAALYRRVAASGG